MWGFITQSRKFLLLLICFNFQSVLSATPPSFPNSFISTLTHGQPIIELGVYQGTAGKTQHVNIQDLIGDTFTLSNQYDNSGLIGLGYFINNESSNPLHMNYGINAFYLGRTSVSGNVIQEDIFTNLSYSYDLVNYPIYAMIKSAINFDSPNNYAIIVDGGIGPNFMHTYSFKESSLDGMTVPEKPFSSNTTTTFSATLGVGLKINHALCQIPVELGYRFFYLGQGHFRANNNQILNNLNTGNVYANSIILSVSI